MEELTVPEKQLAPEQIRVSVGSAIVLGLLEGKLDAEPTTAYLMTYTAGKCTANCGFCPQAKGSHSKAEFLSRVTWPAFSAAIVIEKIVNAAEMGSIRRVCIQTLNYPKAFDDLCGFVGGLKGRTSVPVSVSCQPLNSQNMWRLAESGVERIGIALDAATEPLFEATKGKTVGGPYSWQGEFMLLRTAIGVFGEGNVSTHLIIGLGETEKEALCLIQDCVDLGVLPALFAFTPVKGTAMAECSRPTLEKYRRVQLARYVIINELARFEDMSFNEEGELVGFGLGKDTLNRLVETGFPFLTSGCQNCNRPFYNEKPGGPLFNYPRNLTVREMAAIRQQLQLL